MQWCCFLFWFVYRLLLACLAHFNWIMAIYTNCIYFVLWKSYDLLWFWMHLTLCIFFPQLRRENYLLVWANLIRHRLYKYPVLPYKEIYLIVYGGKGTKAERALEHIESTERREKEERLSRRATRRALSRSGQQVSSSSEDDEVIGRPGTLPPSSISGGTTGKDVLLVAESSVGQANAAEVIAEEGALLLASKVNRKGAEDSDCSDSSNTSRWLQNVPDVIKRKVRSKKDMHDISVPSEEEAETQSLGKWQRFRTYLPNRLKRNRSNASEVQNGLDVLRPNFRNTFDISDEKTRKKREKRDRNELKKKVRQRIKDELKVVAEQEKRRKRVSDAIELLLQLLRMITSFSILVGNIRKTFIPAQFKYLRPGQHAYDNLELLFFFRVTCFIDVSMFWLNMLWVSCLQWQLCCRIGFFRFVFWSSLLGLVAFFVMLLPMSIAMDQLDLSWCHFIPNSTLYSYQPKW